MFSGCPSVCPSVRLYVRPSVPPSPLRPLFLCRLCRSLSLAVCDCLLSPPPNMPWCAPCPLPLPLAALLSWQAEHRETNNDLSLAPSRCLRGYLALSFSVCVCVCTGPSSVSLPVRMLAGWRT